MKNRLPNPMRVLMAAAVLFAAAGAGSRAALGADDAARLHLRIQIADKTPVETEVIVMAGSTQRIAAAPGLSYAIEAPPAGNGADPVVGLETLAGNVFARSRDPVPAGADGRREVSFTVCAERVIRQNAMPSQPARCADLPPMANVDPRPDGCIECLGAYEGMPERFGSNVRIAQPANVGERIVLNGRVLGPNGLPRAGVIIYAFQPDSGGFYPPPQPPRSTFSQSQGQLRAWARSDEGGHYSFDTRRPGSSPSGREPARIHMVVIEPGCAAYFIEDIHFSDDPLLAKWLATSKEFITGVGGSGVVTPIRDGSTGIAYATRDIHLGEGFRNYPACGAAGAAAP